ncbi:hypothetical protein [Vallitalea okinawensis]|uniref:hypothetical protein n=1 Tax=Vallitalea okinawensis TaxID=2078660 RepID=UPI000CFCAE78|nr:hypothetical protein [Vallitalea okinawensis]
MYEYSNEHTICNCCTESLSRLICEEFKCGDIIGLTFIESGVASIATGRFVDVVGAVVIINDLLLEDTTSYIPLCDVSSVEKGITSLMARNTPTSIKLDQ